MIDSSLLVWDATKHLQGKHNQSTHGHGKKSLARRAGRHIEPRQKYDVYGRTERARSSERDMKYWPDDKFELLVSVARKHFGNDAEAILRNYAKAQIDFSQDVYNSDSQILREAARRLLRRKEEDEFSDNRERIIGNSPAELHSKQWQDLLEAEREMTTEYVRRKYGDEITLYRGVGQGIFNGRPELKPGDEVTVAVNSLSSWTKSEGIATEFATNKYGTRQVDRLMERGGAVVEIKVKASDVFIISDLHNDFTSQYRSQLGFEFVVGSKEPEVRVKIKATTVALPTEG